LNMQALLFSTACDCDRPLRSVCVQSMTMQKSIAIVNALLRLKTGPPCTHGIQKHEDIFALKKQLNVALLTTLKIVYQVGIHIVPLRSFGLP